MIMNTLMLNGTLNMYDSGTTLNCCIIVDSETSDEDIICVQAKIHEGTIQIGLWLSCFGNYVRVIHNYLFIIY